MAILIMLASMGSATVQAADPKAGQTKARACAVCHGEKGIATHPAAPNLAGQPQVYLGAELKNYRSGKRVSPEMNVIAKPLTDADIDDLAAWYSSVAIEVKSP